MVDLIQAAKTAAVPVENAGIIAQHEHATMIVAEYRIRRRKAKYFWTISDYFHFSTFGTYEHAARSYNKCVPDSEAIPLF